MSVCLTVGDPPRALPSRRSEAPNPQDGAKSSAICRVIARIAIRICKFERRPLERSITEIIIRAPSFFEEEDAASWHDKKRQSPSHFFSDSQRYAYCVASRLYGRTSCTAHRCEDLFASPEER